MPDYLVITHQTFVDPLAALVALRAQQGYTPALIDIEDVYDEFSFGQKTPQALKDFLTRAQTGWPQPPRFVVLAGDATIDPRDYAGFGDADFVPTKLVDMDAVELESATDEWFADADEDGLPELAVGRLPMRTVEQAETMVAKLVNYAQAAAGAWTKEVVLLADSDDPTWSFEVDTAQLRAVLPGGYTAHSVLAGAAGGTAAARTELFDLVSQGQLLVNYLGHGSTYVWGKHADLLTSADVTGGWQPQAGLPVVVAMNCLNGFFQGIYGEESLAETFLRAPQGAVAMWASSSITYAAAQAGVNQEFVRLVVGGRTQTVGEAVVAAKAVVKDRDVRQSWIFFGDPAMRLKGVPQAFVPYEVSALTPAVGPTLVAGVAGDEPDPADAAVKETDETPAERPAAAQHLADFDGDGRADVFVYAPGTGHWYLALTEAHDFRYHAGQWAPGLQLVAAQLTDDGLADLFGYDAETGAWVQALTHLTQTDHLYDRGAGPFTTHAGVWAPGWQVGVGDLDGDGREDVFVSDATSGMWFQSLTDGAGGFTYRGGRGLPVGQVHLPDFNGDGRADLFVNDGTTGRWSVGLNDGAGGFTFTRGQGTAALRRRWPTWMATPGPTCSSSRRPPGRGANGSRSRRVWSGSTRGSGPRAARCTWRISTATATTTCSGTTPGRARGRVTSRAARGGSPTPPASGRPAAPWPWATSTATGARTSSSTTWRRARGGARCRTAAAASPRPQASGPSAGRWSDNGEERDGFDRGPLAPARPGRGGATL